MIFQKFIIRPNILQFTTTLQRHLFPWNGRLFSRKFTTINPYHILGVDKNADRSKIKQKFIELAKLHHPDVGGNPETFRKVREAYEALIKHGAQSKTEKDDSMSDIVSNSCSPYETRMEIAIKALLNAGLYCEKNIKILWDNNKYALSFTSFINTLTKLNLANQANFECVMSTSGNYYTVSCALEELPIKFATQENFDKFMSNPESFHWMVRLFSRLSVFNLDTQENLNKCFAGEKFNAIETYLLVARIHNKINQAIFDALITHQQYITYISHECIALEDKGILTEEHILKTIKNASFFHNKEKMCFEWPLRLAIVGCAFFGVYKKYTEKNENREEKQSTVNQQTN